MVEASQIREHMGVRDVAGVHVGTVDRVEADRLKLTRTDSADGQHHYIPLSAISRVDAHVHLDATAAALGLVAVGADAAKGGEHPLPPVQNRAVSGAAPRGNFYLPWLVGLVGLALLFFLFRGCVYHKQAETVAAAPSPTATVVAQTSGAPASTALSGLGAYLGGTGATPRTFTFDQLHFDTAKSAIRAADQAEVTQVAAVLKRYGTAKVRIAGYADARGSGAGNDRLGQARADAVKAALVADGIDEGRVSTTSGGAGDPAATNATAAGQQENRRTELQVVSR